MTLPTDYVDGDVLTAADVNAITTAVNAISPVIENYKSVRDTGTYTTTATSFTNTSISLSYTPLNASNVLIVEATFQAAMFGDNQNQAVRQINFEIYDSNAAAVISEGNFTYETEVAGDDPEYFGVPVCLRGRTTANSTTARTYVVRYKTSNAVNTAAIGNNPILSVTEVKP